MRVSQPRAIGVVTVALIAVVVAWFVPQVADNYALSQLSRLGSLGLLAVSVALLTGYCGLPTLGQVAPFAVGAYATFQLAEAGTEVGPAQLLISAVLAGAFSLAAGPFVLRARGIVFLMITLAIGILTGNVAEQWKSVTGGTEGSGYIPSSLMWWGGTPLVDEADIYHYVLIVCVLVTVPTVVLLRGLPGKLLRGVRDNEARMRASGHRVPLYLLAAYVAAGVIAGVAGSLFASSQRFVFPADVGFDVAAVTLLAVIIGGAQSMPGAFAGTAVVMAVRYWIAPEDQSDLWLGLLFIAAVYFLPEGVTARLADLRRSHGWSRLWRVRGRSQSG